MRRRSGKTKKQQKQDEAIKWSRQQRLQKSKSLKSSTPMSIDSELGEKDKSEDGGFKFYGCYLLTSVNPRFKGHTYIGFVLFLYQI